MRNTSKMRIKNSITGIIEDIEAYKEEAMTYRNIRELTVLQNYVLIKCSLLEEEKGQQRLWRYRNLAGK